MHISRYFCILLFSGKVTTQLRCGRKKIFMDLCDVQIAFLIITVN